MLRSTQTKKKVSETEADYVTLSWTNTVVRFSEKDQLIDVLDVFGTIYGSVTSATSAQTRWFKEGEKTEKTAGLIGKDDSSEYVYKVKWEGEPRQRLALKIDDMYAFLTKCIPNMPRSKDFAEIINTSHLTAVGARDRPGLEEKADVELVQDDKCSGNTQFKLNLSTSGMQKYVSSRQMVSLYEAKIQGDREKMDADRRSVFYQTSLAEAEYNQSLFATNAKRILEHRKATDDFNALAKKAKFDDEKLEEDRAYEKRKRDRREALEQLQVKIKVLDELGMYDDANRFKQVLLQM